MSLMRSFTSLVAVLALTTVSAASGRALRAPPSTLIRDVLIVDGTGAAPRTGSVRIRGDHIVVVGQLKLEPGDRLIEGHGLALAPGFIDAHSHHDLGIEKQPSALAATTQGVTTIVVGQDGSSHYPLSGYFRRLERSPVALNIASYSGHGTIRAAVMGKDYRRVANASEITRMKAMLRADMKAGALGLSSGLEYDPGLYASESEVIELARTAAAFGGRYISHVRSEDRGLWKAVNELLDIGRIANLPVELSHAKVAMVPLWGQAPKMLGLLENARRQGIEATADVYPYTYWQSTLQVLFPNRDFKNKLAAEAGLKTLATAEGLRLSRFRPDPSLVGKTLAQISQMRGTDPAQTLMDLIAAAPNPDEDETVIGTSMRQDDVDTLIRWPRSSICSDGQLDDLHPRGAGAFTKVLRDYVRERRLLTLQEAVHKMTGLTAQNLGIRNRGVIKPGAYADLVLFDPARVADKSTIEEPHALSVGVERVWVNGTEILRRGRWSGARPGRVILRSSTRSETRWAKTELREYKDTL
jgi:N-acyl-D-amino-acid deacylase